MSPAPAVYQNILSAQLFHRLDSQLYPGSARPHRQRNGSQELQVLLFLLFSRLHSHSLQGRSCGISPDRSLEPCRCLRPLLQFQTNHNHHQLPGDTLSLFPSNDALAHQDHQ